MGIYILNVIGGQFHINANDHEDALKKGEKIAPPYPEPFALIDMKTGEMIAGRSQGILCPGEEMLIKFDDPIMLAITYYLSGQYRS